MKKAVCLFFSAIAFSGILLAQPVLLATESTKQVVPLWPNGTPGFEDKKNEPELAKDYWVKNIHNPSLTVYLPAKEKANGASVIICPGGGHNKLVITSEGKEAAEYFASIGVTAFVLKYRLFREDSSVYKPSHAAQDGLRAMRMLRQYARQWNLDPNRIGLMGFSAGGELAGWVAFNSMKEDAVKKDSIDKQNSRPDFLIMVYPGPLVVPDTLPAGAPPLFIVAANNDECCSEPVVKLLQQYRKAKAKIEVHLYEQGDHAFNMGKRSKFISINKWPQRLEDWLLDNGYLNK